MENIIILNSERRHFPSSNKLVAWLFKNSENLYLKIIYTVFILPKLKRYFKWGNTKIISMDKETDFILNKNRLKFASVNDYLNDLDSELYKKETMEFINKLPELVPEIDTKYKNMSLWEFEKIDLYWAFFQSLILELENINNIINIEKPKRLIVLNSWSKNGMLQNQFAHKIKVIDKTNLILRVSRDVIYALTPFILKPMQNSLIKTIKNGSYNPHLSNPVVFFDRERAFSYSVPFLKNIKEKVTILQDEEYKENGEGFNFDSIVHYMSNNSKKKIRHFNAILKRKLRTLKKSKTFKSRFKYKNINLFDIFKDMLDFLFIVGYFKSSVYYETLNNFLKINQIKLIIIMGEEPKSLRAILYLSKKYNIHSLSVMHGTFGYCPEYNDLLSDSIAVYGKHFKNLIRDVNTGNDNKNIVITGNPAWDYLMKTKFEINKIFQNLRIKRNKKIILLATTHIPIDIRNGLAYAAIKAMKRLSSQYVLIIKLHPEEKPDFYKNLLKEYGVKAIIIEDVKMLHPLIFISELVIVSHSTVGIEALILDKPLIDVNLTKMPFYQDYVKEGVALGVRNEEDLLPAIKSILENEVVRKKLEKNRQKYVYEHAYKMDGKAAERVTNLIKEMIK